MAAKAGPNGMTRLKNDLKMNSVGKLYIFCGTESYLKEHYLKELIQLTVDETFRDFNLQRLDGRTASPETISEAIESYPAMSERKVVVIYDFDLYKMPATFRDFLPALLCDLPEYICLIFYYDILECKPDKRLKVHSVLNEYACFVEFTSPDERELVDWIHRHFQALHKSIDHETCLYMIFLCGNSMTNLLTEIEKAAAYSTVGEVTRRHLDAVCSRVLDSVVFDLTDALADRKFERAISLIAELIAQKNDEIQIFSTVIRHLQRIYGAKLVEQTHGGERELLDTVGAKSPYFARKLAVTARRFSIQWLRNAVLLCAATDSALKSLAVDRQKLIELTILNMATDFGAEEYDKN